MSDTSTYTSLNKVNLNDGRDFIFTFDVVGSKHRDFTLIFKVSHENTVNEFSISNNLDDSYIVNNNGFSVVKKSFDANTVVKFFNDELIIFGDDNKKDVYKQFSNEPRSEIKGFYYKDEKLYVKTDLYSFEDGHIIRKNPQLSDEIYLRPVVVKKNYKTSSGDIEEIEYFDTLDNLINSNENKTYRIIVSDGAGLISLLVKEGETYKTIKNFTYPTDKISEGSIILEVDNDMELRDLHFSFFKA